MPFKLLTAVLLLTLTGCSLQQARAPEEVDEPVAVAAVTTSAQLGTAAPPETSATAAADETARIAIAAAEVQPRAEEMIPAQLEAVGVIVDEVGDESVAKLASTPAEPLPPENLWDRIRDGLALGSIENARIQDHIKWLKKHPEYVDRVAKRASPYLYLIVDEVERRGIPLEIAMLPIVESSFQPFAYSHGRAAGLWQFIPATGRLFGLKQNWWYDGRRDVVASTRAAINYLDKLQKRFDGDWLLALASYNAGEGTVIRAQRRNAAKGKPTDFWSLDLPRETRAYVPKLLAVSRVFTVPGDFGLSVKPIANEPAVVLVDTGAQIDLAKAAKLADLSVDLLYRLNPGFNRWATDPTGPHHLLVPIGQAERLRTALARLGDRDRLEWRRHKIRSGESLISIAKTYHTTPAVLREANSIRGNLIRAGRHMLIPVASANATVYTLSEDQRRSRLGSHGPAEAAKVTHTVRAGDNLWDLGRRYGVSTRQIANWNGIGTSSTLRIGQKLSVWVNAPSTGSGNPASNLVKRSISYTVRNGDSLSRISQRFKVSVNNLIKWNALKRGAYLQPGQKLMLHIDVTRQSGST